jgi:acyl transferase domain-containing protein
VRPGDSSQSQLPLVFMYSGQGSQYYQMGRELYLEDARFRRVMQELDGLVERHLGESVLQHIYDERRKKSEPFVRTRITHQAIFMVEYALTQVLLDEGLRPSFVLGSSLGEVTAAAVSGIVSLEDCVELLVENARLLEGRCERGGMIAVIHAASLYESEPALHGHCELASVSWDSHFVVSGGESGLSRAEEFLKRRDILHQRLPVEYGFHSSSLESVRVGFQGFLSTVRYNPPRFPFVSCARAGVVESMADDHFWHAFRGRIEFLRAIRHLESQGSHFYLDVGPSGTLSTFIKQILPARGGANTCPTLTPFGQDLKTLARARSMISGS